MLSNTAEVDHSCCCKNKLSVETICFINWDSVTKIWPISGEAFADPRNCNLRKKKLVLKTDRGWIMQDKKNNGNAIFWLHVEERRTCSLDVANFLLKCSMQNCAFDQGHCVQWFKCIVKSFEANWNLINNWHLTPLVLNHRYHDVESSQSQHWKTRQTCFPDKWRFDSVERTQ